MPHFLVDSGILGVNSRVLSYFDSFDDFARKKIREWKRRRPASAVFESSRSNNDLLLLLLNLQNLSLKRVWRYFANILILNF